MFVWCIEYLGYVNGMIIKQWNKYQNDIELEFGVYLVILQ